MRKKEGRRANPENQAPDDRTDDTEDELLFRGCARAEPGDQDSRNRGRDARPRDRPIDDVADRRAKADLQGIGNGLGLTDGSGNQKWNLHRRKRPSLDRHIEDGVHHALDPFEQRGIGRDATLRQQFLPTVRRNGTGAHIAAELSDVRTALPEIRIGDRRMLPPKSGRQIHQLRQHCNPHSGADGKRARIQVAFDDGVVEPLHTALSYRGQTRNASHRLMDQGRVRSLGIQTEHILQCGVARDALPLEVLSRMPARKDIFHCNHRANRNRDGSQQIEHLLDQRTGRVSRLPHCDECAVDEAERRAKGRQRARQHEHPRHKRDNRDAEQAHHRIVIRSDNHSQRYRYRRGQRKKRQQARSEGDGRRITPDKEHEVHA